MGLIADEERKARGIGEFLVGRTEAGEAIVFGPAVEGFFEQVLFDGPGAAEAPVRGGHFLDHAEFDAVAGAKSVKVLAEEDLEVFGSLVGKNGVLGQETVAQGVHRGAAFTGRSDGSPRAGTITSG
jgi:hypothetical protein